MIHKLLVCCKEYYDWGTKVIHIDMNRIYAIFIILYCWEKTHSQEYTGIQEYHAPESLHARQYLNQNQSNQQNRLSYQQILRKLLLPYHQQLPYCYHLPSPYYQNASLQQETLAPSRYLLFYYNSFYHHLPSYQLQPVPYLNTPPSFNTSYDHKPSSGFLVFYYNTFYHQNPQAFNYQAYSTFVHSRNSIQRNHISMWKTTLLPHQRDGWSYSKTPALTPKCMASKHNRTISLGAQNMFLSNDAFNTCIYSVTEREKTSTCNLLGKLLSVVKKGPGSKFFQKQLYPAYKGKRLYVSSNGKLNGFSTVLNLRRVKSKTKECKNGLDYGGNVLRNGDFLTEDWQNLDNGHLNKNKFSFVSISQGQQQITDYVGTSKCPDIFKLWNNTYDYEIVGFSSSGYKMIENFTHNQISSKKKYLDTNNQMLDFQREDNCSTECVHAQICCK